MSDRNPFLVWILLYLILCNFRLFMNCLTFRTAFFVQASATTTTIKTRFCINLLQANMCYFVAVRHYFNTCYSHTSAQWPHVVVQLSWRFFFSCSLCGINLSGVGVDQLYSARVACQIMFVPHDGQQPQQKQNMLKITHVSCLTSSAANFNKQ